MANFALNAFQTLSRFPLGTHVFSRLAALKAPYFRTITPHVTTLEPGRSIVGMKKRWSVTNHLGTVHAIAMCNLAEVAGGLCAEVTTPATHRWIPKGMTVEYQRKAKTDLRAVCEPGIPAFGDEPFDWPVTVNVLDTAGEQVFAAIITMYITPKK